MLFLSCSKPVFGRLLLENSPRDVACVLEES